ncbi:hypothetical protein PTKIN_Ptkin08bG0098200 [Pterospermum kingtungense]
MVAGSTSSPSSNIGTVLRKRNVDMDMVETDTVVLGPKEPKEGQSESKEMKRLRIKWKFASCLAVPAVGRSGGLALLWQPNVEVHIQSYSNFHIDANVFNKERNLWWRFTGLYGNYVTRQRVHSWHLLRDLASKSSLTWLVAGDFNGILRDEEKIGGRPRPMYLLNNFKAAVSDCNLLELPIQGLLNFTWFWRLETTWIMKRIDRGFATQSWLILVPVSIPSTFKFENFWVRYAGCEKALCTWDKELVGRLPHVIEQKKTKDNLCQFNPMVPEVLEHIGIDQ